jgi:lipopolysaccharide/colanic/teichoic acid biosynthesis glycosyltransferase
LGHEVHFAQLVETDRPMTKLDAKGDGRLIPSGWLLRATGLDELPQLINVLRGEMSLVGPRPCTAKELPAFAGERMERFNANPGLTGYWQTHGKNNTTFSQTPLALVAQVRESQAVQ